MQDKLSNCFLVPWNIRSGHFDEKYLKLERLDSVIMPESHRASIDAPKSRTIFQVTADHVSIPPPKPTKTIGDRLLLVSPTFFLRDVSPY